MNLHTNDNKPVKLQFIKLFAITPSDTVDIEIPGAVLYCNADMTLAVVLVGDDNNDGHILKLSKGYHPIQVKRVLSTGTDLGGESLFGGV